MAKWDLSKLPEGRKPLPDEWFAERAQMQDRIKWLEAELAEYKHVASAIDNQWAESQDEIADLKAKQKKAAQYFAEIIMHCANFGRGVQSIDERIIERCEETAANAIEELAGGKDE